MSGPGGSDLAGRDAASLRELFVTGQASAAEILDAHLHRIARTEPAVDAFLHIDSEGAARQARLLDDRRASGEPAGSLAGVPVAIKDVLCVEGMPATCGSKILEGFHPPFEATCVKRLRAAGAIVVGKTNMDEFAMGSSTEHSAWKMTRNPWDLDRVPGGSSGGSAAAVAARQVPLAVGTDTGGSIRQPGAFTGTVGFKPTYGRVSRFGLIAFASSLDQAGPFSRTVKDAAIALEAMSGHDPRDMTSAPVPVSGLAAAATSPEGGSLKGLRVGIPREFFGAGLDAEVATAVRRCARLLEERGAALSEISLPTGDHAIATYYVVATAEASSNLARFDGVRYGMRDRDSATLRDMYRTTRGIGFGAEVKRRIMLGTFVLSAGYYDAYYLKAMKARTLIRRDFDKAFEQVDLILGPTTPTPAFKFGEKTDDPLAMYLSDIYTVTANLAGLPALSLPCGFTRSGLPIGCHLIGRYFDEAVLLKSAGLLEESLQVDRAAPVLAVDR